jgi:hypothetical protein
MNPFQPTSRSSTALTLKNHAQPSHQNQKSDTGHHHSSDHSSPRPRFADGNLKRFRGSRRRRRWRRRAIRALARRGRRKCRSESGEWSSNPKSSSTFSRLRDKDLWVHWVPSYRGLDGFGQLRPGTRGGSEKRGSRSVGRHGAGDNADYSFTSVGVDVEGSPVGAEAVGVGLNSGDGSGVSCRREAERGELWLGFETLNNIMLWDPHRDQSLKERNVRLRRSEVPKSEHGPS